MDCKKCCQNDFSAFKEATMFHTNLYACLYELFNTKKHKVCGLINVEYNYSHKDWFTGKKYLIPLGDAIDFYQQKEMDRIKNNSCKVVLEDILLQIKK